MHICLYTHTQSIQKQIVEYNRKSKYPEEYSTVNKVGSENLFVRSPVSCKINCLIISYLLSKKAWLNAFKSVVVL